MKTMERILRDRPVLLDVIGVGGELDGEHYLMDVTYKGTDIELGNSEWGGPLVEENEQGHVLLRVTSADGDSSGALGTEEWWRVHAAYAKYTLEARNLWEKHEA